MIYQYKVMCCCECCISTKSMHYSLLTWHFWGDSSGAFQCSTPLVTPPPPPNTPHRLSVKGAHIEPFHLCRGIRTVQTSTPAPFSSTEPLDTCKPVWFATQSYVDSSGIFHTGSPSVTFVSWPGIPHRGDIYTASPPRTRQPRVLTYQQST